MKAEVLRKKDNTALVSDLTSKQKELADAKFDLNVGKEKDPSRINKLKKDVARMLTIQNELKTMKVTVKSDKMNDSVKKSN